MSDTKINQVYKCEICGNIVEVIHGGKPVLTCCDKPMVHYSENTVDAAVEKHVPVVERSGSTVSVTVGSVEHPMDDDHYIEWIQVLDGDRACRKYLKPGESPVATFEVAAETITVREYCNLHGLWKA